MKKLKEKSNYMFGSMGKLIVSSVGGASEKLEKVKDALADMYDNGMTLEVEIVGMVAGAGVYLAFSQCSEKPKIKSDAYVMLTSHSAVCSGSKTKDLEKMVKDLEERNDRMAEFLSKCGNKSKEYFLELMKAETYLSAKEVEELGLATII